eukprot:GHUV01036476.1.p1 GENE.GHUV01036476.1~~GHUV01036476.1.p1  ORF type:complete len:109 (-),score=21.11 GHUV01036476.1:305-631(-)
MTAERSRHAIAPVERKYIHHTHHIQYTGTPADSLKAVTWTSNKQCARRHQPPPVYATIAIGATALLHSSSSKVTTISRPHRYTAKSLQPSHRDAIACIKHFITFVAHL